MIMTIQTGITFQFSCIYKILITVVWDSVKNFHRTPGMMKIKHTKIFLLQRNRTVYNGL